MEQTNVQPVVLPCVGSDDPIVIVRARRLHHARTKNQPWENTEVIYITSTGESIELDNTSDVLKFGYLQNEVADKLLRVLDEPNAGMWLLTASALLRLAAAAAVEEAVPEDTEDKAEALAA